MNLSLNLKPLYSIALSSILVLSAVSAAQGNEWTPVTGSDALQNYMSGMKAERTLPSGEVSRGEYKADGSGTLTAWGADIARTWEVKGEDQVCITEKRITNCYQIEKNSAAPNLYRARNVASGEVGEFEMVDGKTVVTSAPKDADAKGGAATPSADEIAAELANPNTAVATLTLKTQYRWFTGDLPDAGNQSSPMLLFQPSFPFKLASGDMVLWRPALPLLIDQPVFDASTATFDGETGLGDFAFDLAYAPKIPGGWLIATGLITAWPTATNDLGSDRFTLGPELLIGKLSKTSVLGIFPNHQWDIGGSGDVDINLTTIQAFATFLPGGGWNVGSAPIMSYDWNSEQWTIPLQLNIGKTVVMGGRPWKLSFEINYYVEQPDPFGPDWMIGFNVAPVVKNGLAGLFGLGKD
jgi:hypothetical protein